MKRPRRSTPSSLSSTNLRVFGLGGCLQRRACLGLRAPRERKGPTLCKSGSSWRRTSRTTPTGPRTSRRRCSILPRSLLRREQAHAGVTSEAPSTTDYRMREFHAPRPEWKPPSTRASRGFVAPGPHRSMSRAHPCPNPLGFGEDASAVKVVVEVIEPQRVEGLLKLVLRRPEAGGDRLAHEALPSTSAISVGSPSRPTAKLSMSARHRRCPIGHIDGPRLASANRWM